MDQAIFSTIFEKSISVAVLLFITIYFMRKLNEKDLQHIEITKQFIELGNKQAVMSAEVKNAIVASTSQMLKFSEIVQQQGVCRRK